MEIKNINTYNNAPERAFETICSQLFENWLKRSFTDVKYFSVVNGAGGDGGVEAYAVRENGNIIGLQAKWFISTIYSSQIKQIEKSIKTAKEIRPELKDYIICIPRETNSKKKVKDNKIGENTEENRINSLISRTKKKYPDLNIQLWKPTRIIRELSFPENDGLIKLWFEKEEISFETLKIRFELARESWLLDRYFPDLHNQGEISDLISQSLVTRPFIRKEVRSLQEIIDKLTNAVDLSNFYISNNNLDAELNSELTKIVLIFPSFISVFENFKLEINNNFVPVPKAIEELNIYSVYSRLMQATVPNILRETHRKLESLLFELHQTHLSQFISDKFKKFVPHNNIILGPVGSGKTHALAYEVERKLLNNELAMLIRAKDCNKLNWKSILSDSLQCCYDWSDVQILTALSSLARNRSTEIASKDKENKFLNQNIKFLICIDGIDESSFPKKWEDLINETKVWLDRFPNIRFVFTCRNYYPHNQNPFSLPHDEIKIRRKDIYMYENSISFDYLKHFQINYTNTPWIINSFENGLSLRLFCEEYRGKDLSDYFDNPVFNSSHKLLTDKLCRLETEYSARINGSISDSEQMVKKALNFIIDYFLRENKIDESNLRNSLWSDLEEVLSKKETGILLDLLTDNGFLICQRYDEDTDLLTKKFYEIGIQTYFDFLIAKRICKDIIRENEKVLPQHIEGEKYNYVRELVGLELVTQYDRLIGTNGLWTSNFSEWELLQLQFRVLSLTTKNVFDRYTSYLKELFLIDRDRFVKYFVIPNSSREDLNIIQTIVHQILLDFQTTYERDKFWSGPDEHEIVGFSHLSYCFEHRSLFLLAKYNQDPLLYSWVLSTTSRPIRAKIKNELTRWALNDIGGFVDLLDVIFFSCNDVQIQEDLSAVIYGLSSLIDGNSLHIEELVIWIELNIYATKQIVKIKNSTIRHGTRCFIERAYNLGFCSKDTYDLSLPPYIYNPAELLSICENGVVTHSGIFPIEHDLYWEDIKKAYSQFLYYDELEMCATMKNILILHNAQHMLPNEFFTRVALQFVLDLGWDKEDGYGDIGSQQFMTFEEKYVWLAIHHIQGYLADRIFYERNLDIGIPSDYIDVVNLHNPAHEEFIKIEYLNINSVKWYIPDDLSPIIFSSPEKIKEDIKKWVINNYQYNFSKWVFPENLSLLREENKVKDRWFVLKSETRLSDPNKIGRAWLKTDCLLLDEENYNTLRLLLENGKSIKLKTDRFNSEIDNRGSVSLLDVIWRESIQEYNNEFTLFLGDQIKIKAFASVNTFVESSSGMGKDKHYFIPSKKVREILKINKSDKISYFDENNSLKVIGNSTHEDSNNAQEMLIADRENIAEALAESKLFPVWVCREFRSTIDHKLIKENNAHFQNCRIWIYTNDNNNENTTLIHEGYYTKMN